VVGGRGAPAQVVVQAAISSRRRAVGGEMVGKEGGQGVDFKKSLIALLKPLERTSKDKFSRFFIVTFFEASKALLSRLEGVTVIFVSVIRPVGRSVHQDCVARNSCSWPSGLGT